MDDADPGMWDYPEHTQAKHDIFGYYLDAWFPILSRWNGRVLIIDGFAGRGEYNDGQPGSPIIALDHLLSHRAWPTISHREFVFMFIEHNAENVASLEQALAGYRSRWEEEHGQQWPANVKYQVRHGTFADQARDLTAYLQQQKANLAPTFAFIDPFGWKGLPLEVISALLGYPRCEVFVNFMCGWVNRFIEHPDQQENMRELFGMPVPDVLAGYEDGDRIEYLRDFYVEQLRARAGFTYVRWFEMRNHTGNIAYYLMHGTRSEVGLEKMKDAMWRTDPSGDYSFSDTLAGLPVLFQPTADLAPLRKDLLERFAGRRGVVVNPDLQNYVLIRTPYRKPHLTEVLRNLEAEQPSPITVNRNGRRQFAAGVTIDFA